MVWFYKTGVRNAEAMGLRVSSIDLIKKLIQIKEVFCKNLAKWQFRKQGKKIVMGLRPSYSFIFNWHIIN
jgi:hypothetical protein